jgi:hypothetical protein
MLLKQKPRTQVKAALKALRARAAQLKIDGWMSSIQAPSPTLMATGGVQLLSPRSDWRVG